MFPAELQGSINERILPRVKVCGITRWEDALTCMSFSVHALGFNFYPRSPRYISPQNAKSIVRRLPPLISCIGVFVNEPNVADVESIAREVGLQAVQLHGEETPAYCRCLSSIPVLKAFRLSPGYSLDMLEAYTAVAFLLDGFKPGEYGGTGTCCDWETAAILARRYPLILSGGLTPANVNQAILSVKPLAVDVCSGVESAPGIKDPQKIRSFLQAIQDPSNKG